MTRRILSLWLPRLLTDWHIRRDAALAPVPFVVTAPDHGRVFIVAASAAAEQAGAIAGLALADARALEPGLHALDYQPALPGRLLATLAGWCLRYTPWAAPDPLDGLWLDITGCAHLFGGEDALLADITRRLHGFGYGARAGLADTPGMAWAVARYGFGPSGLSPQSGSTFRIIPPGQSREALRSLPIAALRLPPETCALLIQLGLRRIDHLLGLPRATLARRFGVEPCRRLDQALGLEDEPISPLLPVPPYSERLAHADGVSTAEGIAQALRLLLDRLCARLAEDGKGLRAAEFQCFRLDGEMQKVNIGTGRPAHKAAHLFRLFAEKLDRIDPGFGIELFVLHASHVESTVTTQNQLLGTPGDDSAALEEFADRLTARLGPGHVGRYVPVESHAPERCIRPAPLMSPLPNPFPLGEGISRPLHLLRHPEPIDVMALLPDYPPAQFRHDNTLHKIRRAEGPERVEPEWWLGQKTARDYYRLENEGGQRFWVFRAAQAWYLHGYFA